MRRLHGSGRNRCLPWRRLHRGRWCCGRPALDGGRRRGGRARLRLCHLRTRWLCGSAGNSLWSLRTLAGRRGGSRLTLALRCRGLAGLLALLLLLALLCLLLLVLQLLVTLLRLLFLGPLLGLLRLRRQLRL